jgi:hypothetical protein
VYALSGLALVCNLALLVLLWVRRRRIELPTAIGDEAGQPAPAS